MDSYLKANQDCDGYYAILLSCIGKTNGGTIHDGVGAPTLSPTFNTFWAPKKLEVGNKMYFVTLKNPSVGGWNPEVRTVIYELTTTEEKKLAAQLVMDRAVKLSVRKFGRKRVKASLNSNYIQLGLDLYKMPLDFGGDAKAY